MEENRKRRLEIVREAIEKYNRYRSPESRAVLIEFSGNIVKVRFGGSFTETCGINDWVEDFRYILRDLGCNAETKEIIEPSNNPLDLGEWRIGVFRIDC